MEVENDRLGVDMTVLSVVHTGDCSDKRATICCQEQRQLSPLSASIVASVDEALCELVEWVVQLKYWWNWCRRRNVARPASKALVSWPPCENASTVGAHWCWSTQLYQMMSSAGSQPQCRETWVVKHSGCREKVQSLFAAANGLVCKRSSNLI